MEVVKKFRLAGKVFFLTWPQNDVAKEQLLDRVVALWSDLAFAVVAAETHKSGEPHLHVIVGFNARKDIKDANAVLDPLTGKHGNYQTAKSAKKVLRYVCKDGQYVTFGEVPDFSEKIGKLDEIAKLVSSGSTMADINKLHPGTVLLQKRKIEDYIGWTKRQKLSESLIPFSLPVVDVDGPTSALVDWMRNNILVPRLPRQKQLWLYGPPGIGKTRFIGQIRQRLRVYDMPRDEDFYDAYEDGLYDLVVLDEYKHQKRLQFMNAWCDGQPLPLRQKGCQTVKNDNLPLIVCSNFSPEECYREGVGRDALIERFEIVQLIADFNLFN